MYKLGLSVVVLVGLVIWGANSISRSRDFQLFGEIVTHVDTDERVIALTFDDGPTRAFTPEVAEMLATRDVTATFFLTGAEMEKNPDALALLIAGGHEIGNHSFSHKRMIFRTPRWVRREINRTDAVIRAAGYDGEIYFRPPFGRKLLSLPYVLAEQGRAMMMWSSEPETNFDTSLGAEALVQRTISAAKPGDILLLHPMYSSRAATREALPQIINGLRDDGYRLVTLGELLELRK